MSRRRGGGALRAARTGCTVALAVALAACAGRGVPETADPDVARSAIERSAPDRPLRVVFDWVILDGEARFSGSGAARIASPYRARLDLFGPRGEGYLSAALVDMELRMPPGTPAARLPPPAMIWAALGVVAPPREAVLVGTRVTPERTELYYDVDESRLRYTLAGGRLITARWEGQGRRMALTLTGLIEPRVPREAFFRDPAAGMELRLSVDEVHEAEPFPPEIWQPDG